MTRIARNGLTIAYEEAGRGAPSMVFVHGGFANRSHFAPQIRHFQKDHRVIAVDLPGHGDSSKPSRDYTIERFGDDVVWLAGKLKAGRAVVVGHSMGGLIALEIGASHPEATGGIAILDAPIVPPAAFMDQFRQFVAGLRTEAYREVMQGFLSAYVGFDRDPARRRRLTEEMAEAPQHVSVSELESYAAYDSADAARRCRVPVLYVGSGIGLSDVKRFRELCPQLVDRATTGTGHYHQLEDPKQVNAILEEFLRTL